MRNMAIKKYNPRNYIFSFKFQLHNGVKKTGFKIHYIFTIGSGSFGYIIQIHLNIHKNSKYQSRKFINNVSNNRIPYFVLYQKGIVYYKSLSDSN